VIRIVPFPHYLTAGVGEEITFRVESPDLSLFLLPKDRVVWFAAEETSGRSIESMVTGGLERKHKFDTAGRYIVAAWLILPVGDPRRGSVTDLDDELFGSPIAVIHQNVQPTDSFMWDPVNQAATHVQNPASALKGAKRYARMLSGIGAGLVFDMSQPGRAALARHERSLEKYQKYVGDLAARLASTSNDDEWIRIPVSAVYSPNDRRESELNVFLAHRRDDGIVKHWKLVDWTHPGDPRLDGEFDGKGKTNFEAAQAAIDAWKAGSNYPAGTVRYTVPAGVLEAGPRSTFFSTHGAGTLAAISDFLEKASLFAAAVAFILTVAPIPGSQFAAAALWIGIFSGVAGAAAASLNIAERHARGVADETADIADGLSLAGCMLGFAGIWVRGAKVSLRVGGTVRELVFLGEVGSAAVHGVMATESAVIEIEQVAQSTVMTPDEKLRRIATIVGNTLHAGLMIYVNVKGTMADMARMSTPKPPSPRKVKPGPHGEKMDGTPSDNLKKLKDAKKKVDLTDDPPVTGTTKEGATHTTTVHADPPRVIGTRTSFNDRFPESPAFWRRRKIGPREIWLQHPAVGPPGPRQDHSTDLFFKASLNDNGVIKVEFVKTVNYRDKATQKLITDEAVGARMAAEGKAEVVKSAFPDGSPALMAKELYPMMFDHFEATARVTGQPITGIEGEFTLANYRAWKSAVQKGADPSRAILDDSLTGKLWKAEIEGRGYAHEMETGFPKDSPDTDSVFWKFKLRK
jgi:hypothetical protein